MKLIDKFFNRKNINKLDNNQHESLNALEILKEIVKNKGKVEQIPKDRLNFLFKYIQDIKNNKKTDNKLKNRLNRIKISKYSMLALLALIGVAMFSGGILLAINSNIVIYSILALDILALIFSSTAIPLLEDSLEAFLLTFSIPLIIGTVIGFGIGLVLSLILAPSIGSLATLLSYTAGSLALSKLHEKYFDYKSILFAIKCGIKQYDENKNADMYITKEKCEELQNDLEKIEEPVPQNQPILSEAEYLKLYSKKIKKYKMSELLYAEYELKDIKKEYNDEHGENIFRVNIQGKSILVPTADGYCDLAHGINNIQSENIKTSQFLEGNTFLSGRDIKFLVRCLEDKYGFHTTENLVGGNYGDGSFDNYKNYIMRKCNDSICRNKC